MRKAFTEKQTVVENYTKDSVVIESRTTEKFVLINKDGNYFVRFGQSNSYVQVTQCPGGFSMTVGYDFKGTKYKPKIESVTSNES